MSEIPAATIVWTADEMNVAMREALAAPAPDLIYVDPRKWAMMKACEEFAGRDRRRIKREMNKAWKRAAIRRGQE